jgi:hypothetical protein
VVCFIGVLLVGSGRVGRNFCLAILQVFAKASFLDGKIGMMFNFDHSAMAVKGGLSICGRFWHNPVQTA